MTTGRCVDIRVWKLESKKQDYRQLSYAVQYVSLGFALSNVQILSATA
jgi:hypothetical protein